MLYQRFGQGVSNLSTVAELRTFDCITDLHLCCGGENVRSKSEEIRQSNCNAYIYKLFRGFMCQSIVSAPYEYIYKRIFLRIIYTRINIIEIFVTKMFITVTNHPSPLRSLLYKNFPLRKSGLLSLKTKPRKIKRNMHQ
jgi:hypothetical protein